MPTATITTADVIKRYADDIAYTAEASPTTDLAALAQQAGTAARNFELARIDGHEDVDTASGHLYEASLAADDTARGVFLASADKLLYPIIWDMVAEYREMVGD